MRQQFEGADDRDHIRRLSSRSTAPSTSSSLRTEGKLLPSADFTRLCEEMDGIKSEQLAWFENCDLILCPVMAKAPERFRRNSRAPPDSPAARCGVSVASTTPRVSRRRRPRRYLDSREAWLPIAIQVIVRPWRDDIVLAALGHIERRTGGWNMPQLMPTENGTTHNDISPASVGSLDSATSPRLPWRYRAASLRSSLPPPCSACRRALSPTDKTDELIFASATKLARETSGQEDIGSRGGRGFHRAATRGQRRDECQGHELLPRARKEAKELDAKAAHGEWMGPLHGAPMTIAICPTPKGSFPPAQPAGVSSMFPIKTRPWWPACARTAAILWENQHSRVHARRSCRINAASNLLYGSSHNPYDLTRTTSGSSGGAGAIVAAGGAAFDIEDRIGAARFADRRTTMALPASSRPACACRAPATSWTTAASTICGNKSDPCAAVSKTSR